MATAIACGGSSGGSITGGSTSVDHIQMSAPTATVEVGAQITLAASAIAADGTPLGKNISWSTASSSIATVTQNGVVTGVAAGLVNITASAGGKTGQTAVTVTAHGVAPTGDYTDVSIVPTLWRTCGRTAVGAVRCWGMNPQGQLGDGTSTDRSSPVQVATTLSFAQVAAGNSETCGRTTGGDLYCWGNLAYGTGTTDVSATPRLIPGGIALADVSIGESSACGRTVGGAAYCWGVNQYGAIGDGTKTDRSAPTAVTGGLSFAQVVVGGDFACGRTSTGSVYCWGRNQLGQLGDGTTTDRLVPTHIAGSQLFSTISAEMTYVCGLTSAGAIYCWGSNFGVVQGTGSGGQSSVPAIVNSSQQFTQIAAGLFHACALTATGAAWCWGNNDHRELGDGSITSTRTTPVSVQGGIAFSKIAAGHWYTCGVSTFGAMYCWGYNGYGNLGNGTTTTGTVPTLVK